MGLLERHAGWMYPYRHPAPQNLIEKLLHGIGTVFRAVGSGMDEAGAMIQGSGGVKETGGCPLATHRTGLGWQPSGLGGAG